MSLKDSPIVELIKIDGSDKDIINAARVYFNKQVETLEDKDVNLIKFLAREGHTSPFRHVNATFRITCPIFIARQIHKHQVGVCVHGDTLIKTRLPGGSIRYLKIKDIYAQWVEGRVINSISKKGKKYQRRISVEQSRREIRNMNVLSCNTETNRIHTAHIADVVKSGIKDCVTITDDNSNTVTLTRDHQVWTPDGWRAVKDLSIGSLIGRNGAAYAGDGTYQNYTVMKEAINSCESVQGVAEHFKVSYHTIRKWMKIHNLQGSFGSNFYPGHTPWNKGVTGYKTGHTLTEEGRERISEARRGSKSNFYVTGKYINHWNGKKTRVARRLFKREEGKCQWCKEDIHEEYHIHHIVPRKQRPDLELKDDNLALLHPKCHRDIHRSRDKFYESIKRVGGDVENVVWEKPEGNTKKVKWVKIVSIKEAGQHEVYDLTMADKFHNFIGNGFVLHNCVNEMSGRYVQFEDDAYWTPRTWRSQSASVKQGSDGEIKDQNTAHALYGNMAKSAVRTYNNLINLGVCKEQARAILPQGMLTSFWMTGTLQAWAHFYKLRIDSHAQHEIQVYAEEISEVLSKKFPVSWKELTK